MNKRVWKKRIITQAKEQYQHDLMKALPSSKIWNQAFLEGFNYALGYIVAELNGNDFGLGVMKLYDELA